MSQCFWNLEKRIRDTEKEDDCILAPRSQKTRRAGLGGRDTGTEVWLFSAWPEGGGRQWCVWQTGREGAGGSVIDGHTPVWPLHLQVFKPGPNDSMHLEGV